MDSHNLFEFELDHRDDLPNPPTEDDLCSFRPLTVDDVGVLIFRGWLLIAKTPSLEWVQRGTYYFDRAWWDPIGIWRRITSPEAPVTVNFLSFSNSRISPDNADYVVNIMTLVNALVLILPITMMSVLQSANWEPVITEAAKCDPLPQSSISTFNYRAEVLLANTLMATIYFPITSIVFTLFYFFCRPSVKKVNSDDFDEADMSKFRRWWRRGRFIVISMFLLTATSIILFMSAVNIYYEHMMPPTDQYCYLRSARYDNYTTGYSAMLGLLAFMLLVVY